MKFARYAVATVFLLTFFPVAFEMAPRAEAHRSGCHRWHTCPSDTGSYQMEFDSSGDAVPYCGSSMYRGSDGRCHYYKTNAASTGSADLTPSLNFRTITGGYWIGSTLYCDVGYYKSGSSCKVVPANGYAVGDTFFCNIGFTKSGSSCVANKTSSSAAGTYFSQTYTPSYSSDTCPANSRPSTTDSSKCTCNTGYGPDATKTKCVPVSLGDETAANNRTCGTYYGSNSIWAGTKNSTGGLNCTCQSGYGWNSQKTSCIPLINQVPQVDYKALGENYYITNKTCIGLSGDIYSYCLTYGLNH